METPPNLTSLKRIEEPEQQWQIAHQDNPSVTPLERHALKALRRQTVQRAPLSRANERLRRPATRLAVAEWNRRHPPLEPAHKYVENCGLERYKSLQSFSKHGGPDLQDLRDYYRTTYPSCNSHTVSSSSRSTEMESLSTDKGISLHNPAFQQLLVDSHVFPPHYEHPDGKCAPEPGNWDHIFEKLAQPRPSLSSSRFSKEQHRVFVRLAASAFNESDVKRTIIPIIRGEVKDPNTAMGGIRFTNLAHLNTYKTLVPGKPDYYHGARPEQLERRVRDELERFIVPSTQHDLPIVPNHFLAVEGPDGTEAVVKRQATYHGCLGARAIRALQSYGHAKPKFDGNAYTFSSTYVAGTLTMYTCHPIQPANPGGQPNYYMNHLGSFAMVGNPETFRTGATWYRNSMKLAEEMRNEHIREANKVAPLATSMGAIFPPTTQLDPNSLAIDSEREIASSVTGEHFVTAESWQDGKGTEEGKEEDDEPGQLPAKRSDGPRTRSVSKGKRRCPQTSSSAVKKGIAKARGRGKAVR